MTEEDVQILSRVILFQALKPEALNTFYSKSRVLEVREGEMVFNREDPADYFYIVLGGWVKVFRITESGDEAILGIFTVGESLAEAAAFLGHGYPASAQVVERARILQIPTRLFLDELRQNPEIAMNMLGAMSLHLHRLVRDVEQLQTCTATRRVVDFLLKQCANSSGAAIIALPYDKTLLARRLGMQPESLSRIWGRLRGIGVHTEQERVVVEDVARLAEDFDIHLPTADQGHKAS